MEFTGYNLIYNFSLIVSWQSDVIETLRHQHSKDLQKVVDIVLSHQVIFFMIWCHYANDHWTISVIESVILFIGCEEQS